MHAYKCIAQFHNVYIYVYIWFKLDNPEGSTITENSLNCIRTNEAVDAKDDN